MSGVVIGSASGLSLGILLGAAFGLTFGTLRGVVVGVTAAFLTAVAMALTATRSWDVRVSFVQMWLSGRGPIRLMNFLQDAHSRGVLRTVGPRYQFRHAKLLQRLAVD